MKLTKVVAFMKQITYWIYIYICTQRIEPMCTDYDEA